MLVLDWKMPPRKLKYLELTYLLLFLFGHRVSWAFDKCPNDLEFCLLPSDYGYCREQSQKFGSFYFTLALALGTYNKCSWKDFLTYTSTLDENKTEKVSSQCFLCFTFTFLLCFYALILFPKPIHQDPNGHDSQRNSHHSSTAWKKISWGRRYEIA